MSATPLHLVAGFLGAGKTTFLNRLLRAPELADALVVVNEFGAQGLDHHLYENFAGDVVLMSSGCLCCSLRGDFAEGLADLLRRRDAGEIGFDRLVVELSGLADPGPVLHALCADVRLWTRLRLANVTTLVDALDGPATLERHGEARRQVALADRLALAKTDLTSDEPVRAALAQARPMTPVYDLARGELPVAEFLAETTAVSGNAPLSPRAAHGDVETYQFRSRAPVDAAGLARFLHEVQNAAGPRLLRLKGLVATKDAPSRPWLLQGAQHFLAPPLRLGAWPDGAEESALVLIGENFSKDAERMWSALCGELAPDTPDWSAIAENPLSPRGGGLFV